MAIYLNKLEPLLPRIPSAKVLLKNNEMLMVMLNVYSQRTNFDKENSLKLKRNKMKALCIRFLNASLDATHSS